MIPKELGRILEIMADLTDHKDFTPYRKLDDIPVELWEGFVYDIREEFNQPDLLIDPAWTAYALYTAMRSSEYRGVQGQLL